MVALRSFQDRSLAYHPACRAFGAGEGNASCVHVQNMVFLLEAEEETNSEDMRTQLLDLYEQMRCCDVNDGQEGSSEDATENAKGGIHKVFE